MEDFDDRMKELSRMSDAELERLMAGGTAGSGPSIEDLEPGTQVNGTVLEIQRDELLVELDGKTLGVIPLAEFGEEAYPAPGAPIQAEFVRYDRRKGVCALTVGGVRTEMAWEDLRSGHLVEGNVVEAVKSGLVLDLKGLRAFMPISQIALERVEDLQPYIGQRLRCEVIEINRAEEKLVVGRRNLLEKERAAKREKALDFIHEGQVVTGRVVRMTEHGAFVNIGDVDGLLHASKIQHLKSPLSVGQVIEVEVVTFDKERGRIGLDFHHVAGDSWESLLQSYRVGERVTGWISRIGPEGAVLSLEEGVEALIPIEPGAKPPADLRAGAVVTGQISAIDRQNRKIVVRI
jgi:small subunit ribosomal protein S1